MFGSSAAKEDGPRVNGLLVQNVSHGQPIARCCGQVGIAGNLIWQRPLKEVRTTDARFARPFVGSATEQAIRAALTTGKGIRAVARECGVGVSVVQRIRAITHPPVRRAIADTIRFEGFELSHVGVKEVVEAAEGRQK